MIVSVCYVRNAKHKSLLCPGSHTLTGLEELVQSVISDTRNSGEEVPEPLATRTFSGRLNLRVTPELHRRIALEALELGESINKHASDRLAAG